MNATVPKSSLTPETALSPALAALRRVDFDWVIYLQDVWHDAAYDVPDLHAAVRRNVADKLAAMRAQRAQRSPLGWVVVGSGGSGKTHLLGAIRREAARQGAGFVMVDMTDVRDFWDTLKQGYLDSLQSDYGNGTFQYQVLLRNFVKAVGVKGDAGRALQKLARHKSTDLARDVSLVLGALQHKAPQAVRQHQDVVRALVCLNSENFAISDAGMNWLLALELEPSLCSNLGFTRPHQDSRRIVTGLSWVMSLAGPTVVAFDQLDPIVHQVGRQGTLGTSEQDAEVERARAIINQIGNGLGAMPDTTCNTLALVSCVEATWNLLSSTVLSTSLDRFEPPIRLLPAETSAVHETLIRTRLAPAYAAGQFVPPYPTWPFRPEAIAALQNNTPREVLKQCDAHRRACLAAGVVTELASFTAGQSPALPPASGDALAVLDRRCAALAAAVDVPALLDETAEDERLAPLYQTALNCLLQEYEGHIPQQVDCTVETEFSGGKTTKPLHARLRLMFHDQNSREEHYCVRALQRTHHGAFKSRLKAAMTQSGIDKDLKFRHLMIVRTGRVPGGAETAKLLEEFRKAGGRFHEPAAVELRTLAALHSLLQERPAELSAWLRARRPISRLGLGNVLAPSPLLRGSAGQTAEENGVEAPVIEAPAVLEKPAKPVAVDVAQTRDRPGAAGRLHEVEKTLPLGRRVLGAGSLGELVALDLSLFCKHTVILGGSGSGKTVTVRRIVEEAALAGIPSLIIDCARDMLCFDETWPAPPETWQTDDAARAARLHASTQMVVWTPGRESGNPLLLEPLPDFAPLVGDPEELEEAVQMAAGGLIDIVAAGNSQKSQTKQGILLASLRYFAVHMAGSGIGGYIDLLSSLPDEAGLGVKQQRKLAEEMADSLKVETAKNPLLRSAGQPLDPAILFGDDQPRERTRISVISLLGLPTDAAQTAFINQLAMLLFSWIKKNPEPPHGRPLRGLLVIDEARDFIPSGRSTACKQSVMRLSAQARKYKLGLIFATQHPKDIETKVVGNCATHLYGLNNAPAALETLDDLMRQKGGDGHDISQLKRGQFYVHNADAGHTQPIKIQMPHSLSFSPATPLTQEQILAKAMASRREVGVT